MGLREIFLKLFKDSLLNQMNTINISHSEHFQEFTNARFTSYSEAVQGLRDKGTELGFAFKIMYQNPAPNIGMVFAKFSCEKGRKAPDYTVRTNLYFNFINQEGRAEVGVSFHNVQWVNDDNVTAPLFQCLATPVENTLIKDAPTGHLSIHPFGCR